MSTYLELKAQIEQLQAGLEKARLAELDAEVIDIKKRIIAFGITPEMLFGKDALPHAPRVRRPPKYAHNGRTWSGDGNKPKWFADALSTGMKREDMLINDAKGRP